MAEKAVKLISETRAWTYVILGGLLEIVWASGFKYETIPSIVVLVSLLASFDLIIRATKVLPVGTVYAVFAGMGTLGTTIVEIAMSGGNVSALRIVFIVTLLACIIGLKLSSKGSEA
ncbi:MULTISPECIES: DMT family transporter [Cohnella]|uniref:Paired small multidrug resistance pump n=1 Tax=Cohnella phaseoli TaxID=456490 RepID=A0A3D9HQI6_9BACL|nr:SMR family transporter [Cohnella phaseoli]RED51655.1 paired small multidrug resistance pump [Cohnella phaseoli]